MTNFEKIKAMSIEEMTEWLDKSTNQDREDWEDIGCYHCCYYGTHHAPVDCQRENCEWLGGIRQWLNREADN
jgi:D-tyrosyl-tRNA(Tyr) deacylase